MKPLFFRAGQQLKEFTIYRKHSQTDEQGRITYSNDEIKIGTIKGSISNISQKENGNWKQNSRLKQMEHPISHTIVVNNKCDVLANDILILDNEKYYVWAKDDPSKLGFFNIIYAEMQIGTDNNA